MLQQDAEIMQTKVEAFDRMIANYINTYDHNRVARKILSTRNVGANIATDVVTTYEETGAEAVIAARGTIPSNSGSTPNEKKHTLYQILSGFQIHNKDMQEDSKLHARNVDICMRKLHKKEDDFAINGSSTLNVNGIADAPTSANTITTSTNNGAWAATESNDIYQDFVIAKGMLDSDLSPAGVLCNPTDANYLLGMDSERKVYWESIRGLFRAREFDDFVFQSNRVTAGNVYMFAKGPEVAEIVIAENAKTIIYPMMPGEVHPVEIKEWVTIEIHNPDGFVKIATG